MATVIAILGAGPHGRQLAALTQHLSPVLYDDRLGRPISEAKGHCLIGAAWPQVRRHIAEQVNLTPYQRGLVLFPGSRISDDVKLGDHTHVGWNAVISHGCKVGSFVNICPGAVLAGEATIEDDVFIGANATLIHGGITIGRGAIIGAGAVVLDNVPPGVTVAGVPAVKL